MVKKDFKKATDSLKETLKINPKFAAAWKQIGHIFFENNNYTNASKYF